MTGNAQVDHRKYVKIFHVSGGQYETLQGVCYDACLTEIYRSTLIDRE